MDTQRKGDIAVSQAIAKFTEMGFDVSLPVSESLPYDVVVDTDEGLRRVQCKYFGEKIKPHVRLRRIHSNSTGYVVKRYNRSDFDWAYVYCKDGRHFLVKEIPERVKNAYTIPDECEI